MSVNLYFVNRTKKQIVYTKQLTGQLEDESELCSYLSYCSGDSIDIMDENCQFIEESILSDEYKSIDLSQFDFYYNRSSAIENMRKIVFNDI